MKGDPADIVARLRLALPRRWFADTAPVLDGLLGGLASVWSGLHGLLQEVRRQSRMATATGGFLDLAALDLFGGGLPRQAGEADGAFLSRIGRALRRVRATRAGLVDAAAEAGSAARVFEPALAHRHRGVWRARAGLGCGWGLGVADDAAGVPGGAAAGLAGGAGSTGGCAAGGRRGLGPGRVGRRRAFHTIPAVLCSDALIPTRRSVDPLAFRLSARREAAGTRSRLPQAGMTALLATMRPARRRWKRSTRAAADGRSPGLVLAVAIREGRRIAEGASLPACMAGGWSAAVSCAPQQHAGRRSAGPRREC